MKKLLLTLIIMLLPVTAFAVSPNTLDREFLNHSDQYWDHAERVEDGKDIITETATLDAGRATQFGVVSVNGDVTQVYFIGWFADMEMLDGGEFSEGLFAYNDCISTLCDHLPDDAEFDSMFSAYDIFMQLNEGPYDDVDEYDGESWKISAWIRGKMAANHAGPYQAVAERMDDGMFWFTVLFP